MSIPLPLTVRLRTVRADRNITLQISDLSFRTVVPGGYASATVNLQRPIRLRPDELQLFGKLFIHDARNGRVVWEGRVEDLGRQANTSGQLWEIVAIGPSVHATDRTYPIIYVDTRLGMWDRSSTGLNYAPFSTGTIGNDATDTAEGQLEIRVEKDVSLPASRRGDMWYRAIYEADQRLARISITWKGGFNDLNWFVQIVTRDNPTGAGNVAKSTNISTGGTTLIAKVTADFTDGHDLAHFRFESPPSTITTGGDGWITGIPRVNAMLKNTDGTNITDSAYYSLASVTATEVVKDLLGRVLAEYDGPNAVVEATSYAIDQLAYEDGTTAQQIFEDLMLLEPAYYWAAWESNTAGLHRFEWRAWPTTVRYEAGIQDGFDSPSSAAEIYNRVRVRYRNNLGIGVTVRRNQVVPELDDAGLLREHFIDLGDEIGTRTNAERVGDNFLAEHLRPPNAGTLTIARPILDRVTGRMVMPWEILPGNLVRVHGVQPRIDSLNASARDGDTVFKMASVDFSAADAAARVELDAYTATVARALADLGKKPPIRRR